MSDQDPRSTAPTVDTVHATFGPATTTLPDGTAPPLAVPGVSTQPPLVDYAAGRPSQALAAWSLGLGIAAIPFALIPVIGVMFGIAAAVAAIILGALALRRRQSRGMALSGIITGSVGGAIGLANAIGSLLVVGFIGAFMLSYMPTQYTADVEAGKTAVVTWTGRTAPDPTATITGPWSVEAEVDSMNIGQITVTAAPDVQVSCTASLDGVLGEKKVGLGKVTCNAA